MSFGFGMGFTRNDPFAGGPSLNLQFAGNTVLDPAVTFTRALNTATYFNSAGLLTTADANVPRFDYDPVTLAPRGLLIEEARTNLARYSEQFDNAAWVKTDVTISANETTAPDGSTGADKLVENTATSLHVIGQEIIPKPAANPTISVYAKAAGRNWLYLNVFPSIPNDFVNDARAYFDLSSGVVGTVTRGTATIVSVGNGWYRCSLSASQFTSTASANAFFAIHVASANGTFNYTGDGTSGIFIWGAQLEAGAFATSYIPTVASQVTRNADVASVNTLSPWYNQAAGTLFAEASLAATGGNSRAVVSADLGSTNNESFRLLFSSSNTSAEGFVRTSSTTVAQIIVGAFTAGSVVKMAVAATLNSANAAANGVIGSDDTSLTMPTPDKLNFGYSTQSGGYLNGHIRRITYYPRRLSNAELQSITS